MKKYFILTGIVAVILLVAITIVSLRPSFRDFQHYADEPDGPETKIVLRQTDTYIFFNLFRKDYYSNDDGEWVLNHSIKYKGFLKNFYVQ